jgi:hypothetical protein
MTRKKVEGKDMKERRNLKKKQNERIKQQR